MLKQAGYFFRAETLTNNYFDINFKLNINNTK